MWVLFPTPKVLLEFYLLSVVSYGKLIKSMSYCLVKGMVGILGGILATYDKTWN